MEPASAFPKQKMAQEQFMGVYCFKKIRIVELFQKYYHHPSVLSKKEINIIIYPRDKPEHPIVA